PAARCAARPVRSPLSLSSAPRQSRPVPALRCSSRAWLASRISFREASTDDPSVPGQRAAVSCLSISELGGGFAPLPNLPPKTGCAGGAGPRSGTPNRSSPISKAWRVLLNSGGLCPPSEPPPPQNRLRRRSRHSERNTKSLIVDLESLAR